MKRWTFLALGFLVSSMAPTTVAHAEARVRVAVASFHGPGGKRMRRAVREGLAAHRRDVRIVATAHADVVVSGTVRHVGRAWIVRVAARDRATGNEVASTQWRDRELGHLAGRVRRQVWPRLRKGLLRTRGAARATSAAESAPSAPAAETPAPPPPAPAAAASGAKATKQRGKPEKPSSRPRLDTIRLSAVMQLFGRRFRFDGDTANALGSYRLGAAPAVAVDGLWFPGAPFTHDALADIGVRLRYERAVALDTAPTANPGNVHYSTKADVLEVGVVGRLPLGRTELGLEADYGRQRFVVAEPASAGQSSIPDAKYQYARFAALLSYRFETWLRLDVEGAYIWPFDPGPLGSSAWFPNASGNGFDTRAVVAFPFGAGFEGRASFEYRWLRFGLSPGSGATKVASAAVEQTYGIGLGLGWRY